jgi:hypothetical protein
VPVLALAALTALAAGCGGTGSSSSAITNNGVDLAPFTLHVS